MPLVISTLFPTLRRWAALLARVLIAFVALCHLGVACATVASGSHDAKIWSEIGTLTDTSPDGDHGHVHAAPAHGDHDHSDHRHGHDAADHSHDKTDLPRGDLFPALKLVHSWETASLSPLKPGPFFTFERPPRSVPVI
jgi:hypothetical protein